MLNTQRQLKNVSISKATGRILDLLLTDLEKHLKLANQLMQILIYVSAQTSTAEENLVIILAILNRPTILETTQLMLNAFGI